MADNLPLAFRIALFGDPNVGKNTLLKTMDGKVVNFKGLEYYEVKPERSTKNRNERPISLEIFYPIDEAKNSNKSVRYHAALILYDRSVKSSFKHIQNFIETFNDICTPNCPICIVGTKSGPKLDSRPSFLEDSRIHLFEKQTNDRRDASSLINSVTDLLIIDYLKDQLNICQEITNELIKHPSSKFFREPVNKLEVQDYYQIIKNPQDLSSIKKRLERNDYLSVDRWRDDIELIFSNCEHYNGKVSFFAPYIKEMTYVFKLLLKKFPPSGGLKNIALQLNSKIKAVNTQCDAPPPEMKVLFPEGIVYTEADLKLPFSEKDNSQLIHYVENLSESENFELDQIMKYFEVKKNVVNSKVAEIDVESLPDKVKIYLRSYLNLKAKSKIHHSSSKP